MSYILLTLELCFIPSEILKVKESPIPKLLGSKAEGKSITKSSEVTNIE